MSELCIQIQPDRDPEIPLGKIRRICETIANDRRLVRQMTWVDAVGRQAYVNVLFGTSDVDALWQVLRRDLYEDARCGPSLTGASLAFCVGQRGWIDSRQLHPPPA